MTNREMLLDAGLRLMHERGLAGSPLVIAKGAGPEMDQALRALQFFRTASGDYIRIDFYTDFLLLGQQIV